MNQRDKQVAILTAAGFTADECAKKLGISTATVDRSRALDAVKNLIAAKEAAGLSPRDVLDSLLYSTNDNTRMKAAVELSKLPEAASDEIPAKLQPGVKRLTISFKHVTVEDDAGKIRTAIAPLLQEATEALAAHGEMRAREMEDEPEDPEAWRARREREMAANEPSQ